MHTLTRLRSGALALAAVTGLTLGTGAFHPTATHAYSCPLETLASGPVYYGTDQQATILVLKNDCDGKIFARISTPYWGTYVDSGLYDDTTGYGGAQSPTNVFLPFGGHVDTSEVVPQSGHIYSAMGTSHTPWSPLYWGQTPTWTAP